MLSSSPSPNTPLIYMHPSPLRFLHTHSSSVLFLVYTQHLNTGDAARECLWIDTFLETKKKTTKHVCFFLENDNVHVYFIRGALLGLERHTDGRLVDWLIG